ncbi:MAG: DUF5666 domain-containing protein, partial [Dehalococcoidia bacterium]
MSSFVQSVLSTHFKFLVVLVSFVLLVAAGCTASERELLEGILGNVDTVNGEITIVTKDGRTVTVTIATDTAADLQTGDALTVELDDEGQVIKLQELGKQTASQFAGDCNDDGKVSVEDANLKVKGGIGTIETACVVSVADGKRLRFDEAVLRSNGGSLTIQSGAGTRLGIDESTIQMGSGAFRFVSGNDGEVEVKESTLTGNPIDLGLARMLPESRCELEEYEQRVRVRDSILTSAGAIRITSGLNCKTEIRSSTLTSGGDIEIAAGDGGETRVSESELSAGGAVSITVGVDGRCRSDDNTPDVECGFPAGQDAVGQDNGTVSSIPSSEFEIDGAVEAVSLDADGNVTSLMVDGRQVVTDAETRVRGAVEVGTHAEVAGQLTSDGVYLASEIEAER